LSPDGRSWWDGEGWQPLYTPDGMGRWDGREWIALGEPFGAPAGIPRAPAAVALVAAPAEPPPLAAPDAVAPPPSDAPSWLVQPPPGVPSPPPVAEPDVMQQPVFGYVPPRKSSRLLVAGGLLMLLGVIAIGGWVVHNQLLANSAANSASATPSQSQYRRAERFMNGKLGPSLAAASESLPAIKADCTSSLPPSCRDAIAATDAKLRDTLAVIDTSDIPLCISTQVAKLRADITEMDAGLQMSIGGFYQGTNPQIVYQGFLKFADGAKLVDPDSKAVSTAEQICPQ
ncbi:MAG: hypothetical protein ABI334_02940, partial [Candidatus Dormiibacterota bacterium]